MSAASRASSSIPIQRSFRNVTGLTLDAALRLSLIYAVLSPDRDEVISPSGDEADVVFLFAMAKSRGWRFRNDSDGLELIEVGLLERHDYLNLNRGTAG